MKFVHQAIKELSLDAKNVAVISDRDCGSVEYARKKWHTDESYYTMERKN